MTRSFSWLAILAACTTASFAATGCHASRRIRPPSQPDTGPGGTDYRHRSIAAARLGKGDDECWIFTPDDPRPDVAPVVVFLHGWSAVDPFVYGAWVGHLVRRGNIVVYPRYQRNLHTRLDNMTPNALRALRTAWRSLQSDGPVRPDAERFALVGHSMGGFIAANLAILASQHELPTPRALMVVEPGDGQGRMPRLGKRLPLVDATDAPRDMLFLMVTGENDTVVGDRGAEKIWNALRAVPDARKGFVTVASEQRTQPRLIADHLSPLAVDPSFPDRPTARGGATPTDAEGLWAGIRETQRLRMRRRAHVRWGWRFPPDALDHCGYWRLFDTLLEAAFQRREDGDWFAEIGNPRSMGLCSDGSPMRPLIVRHAP